MTIAFYIAAGIAIISTILVITRYNAIHALLYLIVSLFAVAIVFFTLGAPFVAALEVIIYAGAIMVLFVFVMMMLNLGERAAQQERKWLKPGMFIGPAILTAVLFGEFIYMIVLEGPVSTGTQMVGPKAVGMALYSRYLLGVELSAMLLLTGLVGAYHLGHEDESKLAGVGLDDEHKELTATESTENE
ncbi:MAG: NADH-quinone oxidoreductase subunit J [Candidatus Zixiibacteriota bacterium]|jgi:NADH-quinone oxidoreductase subunit J